MYRLAFCDVDGTVASFDGRVSPAVHKAMQAVVDSGGWITLSTGRGYQLTKPYLDRAVVNAPLICCNGGLVVEPVTRRVLHVEPMPLPLARDLMRLAVAEGIEMWFYLDDLETMLENRPIEDGFVLRRDGVLLRSAPDPLAELTRPPHKVVVSAPTPEDTPAVIARVQQEVGERARVLASSPRRIEVILPGISKGNAMALVARHLGVKREETIGIGDGNNDVEMLEWAGVGVAMDNASPVARAAADWIAPPVEEDGAAIALRRYMLGW
jgi:hypothetical protein